MCRRTLCSIRSLVDGSPLLGGPPVGRDVVLEEGGPVAGIDELASACIGQGLGEPGLGVMEASKGRSFTPGMPLTR